MSDSTPAKKVFTGSCHCGFIKYTAGIALTDTPTASRCNCTICLKQGYTGIRVSPEDFTLLSPESVSQVKDYQMRSKDIHKYFCGTCGIHVWSQGEFVYEGKTYPLFSINILTLDQPQDGLDLSTFKIQYLDGRNDNWMTGPRDVPWPGQCI